MLPSILVIIIIDLSEQCNEYDVCCGGVLGAYMQQNEAKIERQ